MGTLAAAVRAEGCAFAVLRQRIAAFAVGDPSLERDTPRLFKRFLSFFRARLTPFPPHEPATIGSGPLPEKWHRRVGERFPRCVLELPVARWTDGSQVGDAVVGHIPGYVMHLERAVDEQRRPSLIAAHRCW
jgi:hypothetical protein